MKVRLKKLKGPHRVFCFLMMLMTIACTKEDVEQVKAKAPLRSYIVTARLDNKQTGTDSQATGILKGTYSEKTKLFTYTLNYENVTPIAISINKRLKGAVGTLVIKLSELEGSTSSSPLLGKKHLSSLEERDLIKGAWLVTITSAKYGTSEISGQITLKRN
ncbi:MAG TPA: hypothetical protein DIT07_00655 [Sphingobacteriaceae bacterium]|nr:hypothetical protein [Sphingobacteriaceae bacterium]